MTEDRDSASRQRPSGPFRWFAAMEYYAFILNRTFKVFISDHMLCGAKVRGLVASPRMTTPVMSEQDFWVSSRLGQFYDQLDPESKEFLEIESSNFQIDYQEIVTIDYVSGKKWGMGRVPHSGRILLNLRNGRVRELILLGRQNGYDLKQSIEKSICARPSQT